MPQLMRQGQHIAPLPHPVQEHIGVPVRSHRMGISTRLFARPRLAVDPGPVEEAASPIRELRPEIGETLQHQLFARGPVITARRAGLDRGIAVPLVQLRLAHGPGLERVIAVRQARIGRSHGLGHGVHRLAVDLIGQVPRIRRAFEAPPLVFQRLVRRDRVQHQRHGLGPRRQRLVQPLGRGLAPRRLGIRQLVQRLGQGQVVLAGLDPHRRQRLVEQAGPLGADWATLGQEGLQLVGQLMRLHRPHPPQPGPPARRRGMGDQRRLDLGLLQLVDLQRHPDRGRGNGRQLLPDRRLKPLCGGIVAVRRGGQKGIGPERPEPVRSLFIQRHRTVQPLAQHRRLAAHRDQLTLQAVQLIDHPARVFEVGLDPGVLARGIKVGQVPDGRVQRIGGGLEGSVHTPVVGMPAPGRNGPRPCAGRPGPGRDYLLRSALAGAIPAPSRMPSSICRCSSGEQP